MNFFCPRGTQDEAADKLNLSQTILSDEPATAGNTLGIAKWDIYVASNDEAEGIVAFASDDTAAADVKYALVVDAKSGGTAILQYDKHGPKQTSELVPLSAAVKDGLRVELKALQAKVAAHGARRPGIRTQAAGDATSCATDLAIYGLSALGASVMAGVAVGALVVAGGSASLVALLGSGTATLLGVSTVGATAASVWMISAMSATWDSTVQTCKRAVQD